MRLAIAALPPLLLTAGQVAGQTREAQFGVRATVASDCQVNVGDPGFLFPNPEEVERPSTLFSMSCSGGAAVAISVSARDRGSSRFRELSDPDDANSGEFVPCAVCSQVPPDLLVSAGDDPDVIRVTVQF